MNAYEYAVARVAKQLSEKLGTKGLTRREKRLFRITHLAVLRYDRQEGK